MSATWLLTMLALIAFAANSVLCRMALGTAAIDAAGFTVIRLLAGSLVLLLIVTFMTKSSDHEAKSNENESWIPAIMLFVYAATFSFAYITLETATGALILFAAVQITMVVSSMIAGHRLQYLEWIGMALAFSGFLYLVLPDVTMPSIKGFVLMTIAGVAWGMYTIIGRQTTSPLCNTANNFHKTLPLALLLGLVFWSQMHYSLEGVLLAVCSGAIASAIGYAIWYAALTGLTSMQAAVLQLLVPVLAALGGVIFVGESITLQLTIAAALILSGIVLIFVRKF